MKTVQLGAGERLTVLNLNREGAVPLKITRAAQDIIEGVRASGDEALRRYCKDFDGVEVDADAVVGMLSPLISCTTAKIVSCGSGIVTAQSPP